MKWSVFTQVEVIEVHSDSDDIPVVNWQGFDNYPRKHADELKNAKLIAAAPDLLKALEAILLDWNDAKIADVYRGKPGKIDMAVQRLADARSAVTRAKK